jgi:hypothetical protein
VIEPRTGRGVLRANIKRCMVTFAGGIGHIGDRYSSPRATWAAHRFGCSRVALRRSSIAISRFRECLPSTQQGVACMGDNFHCPVESLYRDLKKAEVPGEISG